MPFVSEKQRGYLFANKPEVAKKFVKDSGGKATVLNRRKKDERRVRRSGGYGG